MAGSSASKAVIRITVVPKGAGQKDGRWSFGGQRQAELLSPTQAMAMK